MKKIAPVFAIEIYNYFKVNFLDKELIRFLTVGGVVFLSNQFFLFTFYGVLGLALIVAQIISSELATLISFTFHHHWTYQNYNSRPLYLRFLHFNLTALGGIIIANVTTLIGVKFFQINYLVGFSVGAIFATFWNYFANKHFIWAQTVDD